MTSDSTYPERGRSEPPSPDFATFEQWRQRVYREIRKVGISRAADSVYHDIRGTYIAERMYGLVKSGLEPARAAALVAREVGHSRVEVLEWYLADLPDLLSAPAAA